MAFEFQYTFTGIETHFMEVFSSKQGLLIMHLT